MKGRIKAICVSEKKGTAKKPVPSVKLLVGHGILGDAHAGNWHRQVSLLSYDKVCDFCRSGVQVGDGDFGENILASGIDFRALPIGTRLRCGEDVLLEITQIGKECHSHCAIYAQVGDCIMPREGVFARVLCEGVLRENDSIWVEQ